MKESRLAISSPNKIIFRQIRRSDDWLFVVIYIQRPKQNQEGTMCTAKFLSTQQVQATMRSACSLVRILNDRVASNLVQTPSIMTVYQNNMDAQISHWLHDNLQVLVCLHFRSTSINMAANDRAIGAPGFEFVDQTPGLKKDTIHRLIHIKPRVAT